MKSEFITWYQTVAMSPQPAIVDVRWSAVEAVAANPNPGELEALVRAAFRWKQSTATTATIRTALAGPDASIEDQEFALLAGATLAVIVRRELAPAARAATMITTAHLAGLRKLVQPMDLVAAADAARVALAINTRRRPALTISAAPPLAIDVTKLAETDDVNEKSKLVAQACQAALEKAFEWQADFARRAAEFMAIQDEELNMLWWLQGRHSGLTGQAFDAIPAEQRPLIFAMDLAKATHALPGAAAVKSLFSHAGLVDEGVMTIAAAIQGLPFEWVKNAVPDSLLQRISPATSPVHEGLKRRLEVDGAGNWAAGWAGVCGIDADASISPMGLATQFYAEQLLLK